MIRDWNRDGKIDAADRAHQYYISCLYENEDYDSSVADKSRSSNDAGGNAGAILFWIIIICICPPIGILLFFCALLLEKR